VGNAPTQTSTLSEAGRGPFSRHRNDRLGDCAPAEPFVLSTDLGRRFRWYVDTAHSTRVTYNYQWDYSIFEAVDISAHSQSWHYFTRSGIGGSGYHGFPVKLRGSVLCCGTLYNRNGYLEV
jgi:hypothetical protein